MRLLLLALACCAAAQDREPKPQPANAAVIRAFDTHNIVMFGEWHACTQEHEWLRAFVSTPEFADRVDDIVVEFGNSLYQKSIDRYITGEAVPFEQAQQAWRNVAGAVGPPSPVYEAFFKAVRAANLKRKGKHPLRVVLGDPYADWDKIQDREDLGPFVANRDSWYAQVVKDEVLAKNHRALLIMGWGHFLRRNGPGAIEQQLRAAGAKTYLVVFGTNAVGGYDDLDKRFDSWPLPALADLHDGGWVGDLPAMPVLMGGTAPANAMKLKDVADALLYVAPRDALTQLFMPRSELEGTAYGKEIARRYKIQTGGDIDFARSLDEAPAFERPRPASGGPRPLGAPPKSFRDPLPPRPPSK
ncbi:MAG TPA: hypothetical protein VKU01_18785 [Bryobacteraceae bacterium]|nr:hypothetical protein [Bryobacteraceae bacterium]